MSGKRNSPIRLPGDAFRCRCIGRLDLDDYLVRLKDSRAYGRMFFVRHAGDVGEVKENNVALIGPDRLARMVFDAGLTTWLREKYPENLLTRAAR